MRGSAATDAPHDERDDDEPGSHQGTGGADAASDHLVGVAREIADQAERRAPGDAAERVPDDEPPVRHLADARQTGHDRAQERRPPAEEHRRPAALPQEPPGTVEPPLVLAQRPPSEDAGAVVPPDLVPHGVADDRAEG